MSNALAALKAKIAADKKDSILFSDNTASPTITTLAAIYNKASHECYINHMDGFKILVSWLTNGNQIPIDYQLHIYPRQIDLSFTIPAMLNTYALQQLAIALVPSYGWIGDMYVDELARVQKALALASLA